MDNFDVVANRLGKTLRSAFLRENPPYFLEDVVDYNNISHRLFNWFFINNRRKQIATMSVHNDTGNLVFIGKKHKIRIENIGTDSERVVVF